MPDIALAVRAETGSSLGHLGVGSMAGQVADAAAGILARMADPLAPNNAATIRDLIDEVMTV